MLSEERLNGAASGIDSSVERINAAEETFVPCADPPQAIAKMSAEERRQLIAEKAYLRAEKRGFAPGRDAEDWLAAEQEVKALADYWLP